MNKQRNEISIKKAALINAVSKYSQIVFNLVITAVLARILEPADYGIVAVATVFTTFFALFADMGIGTGVIQDKTLSDDEVNHIYSFSVYLAVVLGIAFCLFSFPMASFYHNEVYKPVGMLLSVSLIFSTLNMIPNAILMKNKHFVLVAVRNIIVFIITGVIAIVFAFMGFKYYALVLQSVLTSVITFICNYISVKKNYSLGFHGKIDYTGMKKVLSFSGFQFAFNMINYFSRNMDNLLISRVMGESALGYYDKAYKLMLYPVQNLTQVISGVLHPILSDYQKMKEYIYTQYIKIVKLLSIAGCFIMPFCFFAAPELIAILFGEKWLAAVACFRILSLSVWAQMITSSTGAIFQSLGDTKRMFVTGTLNAVISVIGITSGLFFGKIEYVAIGVAIAYNIHFLTSFFVLIKKSFSYSFLGYLKELLPDIIIMGVLFVAIAIYGQMIPTSASYLVSGIMKGCYLGIIYVIMLVITKRYKIYTSLIKRR
ncbi:MAG: lipopolysaccharide biosynthesis protein [Lachnospiraceae bacterium]|nr:lipopolysaccharide biosynthesis protein [Lachnospiraceae bacterium]